MSKLKEALSKLVNRARTAAREAWATEPTRVLYVAASVFVFVCAKLGIVVAQASVLEALAFVVPILLAGSINRSQVTPAKQLLATARNRVVSHHRLRRRARAKRAQIMQWQMSALKDADPQSIAKLEGLGVGTTDRLAIPDGRRLGWWVVEVGA